MPCLMGLLALVAPRLVVVLLWMFTDWFTGVFDFALWPILGFLFLPTTLLWFTAVQHWFEGAWGLGAVAGLLVAVLIDLSPASRKRGRRMR